MNRSKPLTTRKPLSRGTSQLARTGKVRPLSKRRQKARQSAEGQAGLAYMAKVKSLHCVACGAPPPNDAHHCRDRPDFDERGFYHRLPGAGQKSDDRDTIPLCRACHRMFHENRAEFHRLYGRDYGYIPIVRAALEPIEEIQF